MKKGIHAIIGVLFCLGSVSASFAGDIETLKAKCYAVGLLYMADGYQLSHGETGRLSEGEKDIFKSKLYEGNDYVHIVAASDTADDVDIYVFDEKKNLIAKDTKKDNLPIVGNSPSWSGYFYEAVKMYDGHGSYVYMRFWK